MTDKRRYTQEQADQICSEFHGYLTADKIKLVVPPMQHLVDALPNVRPQGRARRYEHDQRRRLATTEDYQHGRQERTNQ